MVEWWRWALVSSDGVAPSRMVSVSASINLPLHHKVQKFSSGPGSSRWSWKNGGKMVVVALLHGEVNLVGLKPIPEDTTSFSVLTPMVGSTDP